MPTAILLLIAKGFVERWLAMVFSLSALAVLVTCVTTGAAQESEIGLLHAESRSLQDGLRDAVHSPDCPAGYYDVTKGKAYWWQCGFGCPGGSYTDVNCTCACQFNSQWAESTTTTTTTRRPQSTTLPVINTPPPTTTTVSRVNVVINTDPYQATTSMASSSGGDDAGEDGVDLAVVLGVTIPLGVLCVPCCTLLFIYMFYLIAHRAEWFSDDTHSRKLAVVKEIGSGIDLLRRRFSVGSLDSNNLGFVHTKREKRGSRDAVPGIAVQSTRDLDLEAARSVTSSAFLPQALSRFSSPDGNKQMASTASARVSELSTSPAGSQPVSNVSMSRDPSTRSAQGGTAPAISASWSPAGLASARSSRKSGTSASPSPRSPIVGAVVHTASVRSWSPAAHPHTPSVRSESPSIQAVAQQASNRTIGPVVSMPVGAYAGQQSKRNSRDANQERPADDECSSQITPQQRKLDELHALRHGVQSFTTASFIQPVSRQPSPNSLPMSPQASGLQPGSPATSTGASPARTPRGRGLASLSVCHTARITPYSG